MKRSVVTIANIVACSNPDLMMVEFRQEVEKLNAVGVLLGKPFVEKRVVFQPVSKEMIAKHNLAIGSALQELEGHPVNLRIVETTTPRRAEDAEKQYNVKRNPSTKGILCHEGKVIYRYTDIDLIGAPDVHLATTSTLIPVSATDASMQ